MSSNVMVIDGKEIVVSGKFPRIARLRAEYYEYVDEPQAFIDKLKASRCRADVLSFLQETAERTPRHRFYHEWEGISVVPITTFDHWWKKQVNDKTRNMVRKASALPDISSPTSKPSCMPRSFIVSSSFCFVTLMARVAPIFFASPRR